MGRYCPNFWLKIGKIKWKKSFSLFAWWFPLLFIFGHSVYGQNKEPDTTRKLTDTTFQLEEVTVSTGYQQIHKERATGSLSFVDSTLFNRTPSTDVLSRLEGVVSGLRFNRGNNNPNVLDLTLRGPSTIQADDQPLIILDNFEYNGDLKNINPNDVFSVTVLKDAAAASIWGAKAGNGVIVITTKTGRYGKPTQVSLSSTGSFRKEPDLFSTPWVSSSDYIDLETYLFGQGYYNSTLSNVNKTAVTPVVWLLNQRKRGLISSADSASTIDAYRQVDARNDLERYFYQTSISQQHALSLTGGGRYNQYYASAGWDKNLANEVGNAYSRLTLNFNNTFGFLDNRLEVKTGVLYTQTTDQQNNSYPTFTYPYAQFADANGNALAIARYNSGFLDTVGQGRLLDWTYRPLDELTYADNTVKLSDLKVNLGVNYRLLQWLKISALYQYGRGNTTDRNYQSQDSYFTRDLINQFSSIATNGEITRPIPLGGILDLSTPSYTAQHFRGQLDVDHHWADHAFQGIIGGEVSDERTESASFRTYGYNEERPIGLNVDYVNPYTSIVTGYKNIIIPNSLGFRDLQDRYVSLYANASYQYRQKYTLTASARKDGSNLFGVRSNQQWAPLWSTGFKWDAAREHFYHLGWLPALNVRLTYGKSGNVDKSVTAYLVAQSYAQSEYGQPALLINNPPNPDLRWETVSTFNAAVDFALLPTRRITGSLEYYHKSGNDLMGNAELSAASGLLTYRGNTAAMTGHGLDVSLNSVNLKGALGWQTTFLYSYTANQVTRYSVTPANNGSYMTGAYQVGKPLEALYAYQWAGLDAQTGNPQGYLNGQVSQDYGAITSSANLADLVYAGSYQPTHFGSLRNSFKWRQFSLSFNLLFKMGYYLRKKSVNYTDLFQGSFQGVPDYAQRWQHPGDEQFTYVPSMVYPAIYARDNFYTHAEALVEKADHIRLQDVRLGYQFTSVTGKHLLFKGASVYLMANQLGLLWKANKSGIDPDYGYQHPQVTLSAGIHVEL